MEVTRELVESLVSRLEPRKNVEDAATLVLGGSWLHHGPPYLAAISALKSGAGRVYLAAPKTLSTVFRAMSPDITVLPLPDMKFTKGCARKLIKWMPKVRSMLLGPGLGKGCREGLEVLLKEIKNTPLILVDEALHYDLIRLLNNRMHLLLLTAKEFQHLFSTTLPECFDEKVSVVKSKAGEVNVTIFLKDLKDIISDGASTSIYNPDAECYFAYRNLSLLAGTVAAYVARGLSAVEAASVGAYVNGLALKLALQEKGEYLVPSELVDYIQLAQLKFKKL